MQSTATSQKLSWATLVGLICVGISLLLIAAVVVLSLIPTFLTLNNTKLKTKVISKTFQISLKDNTVIPVGPLNDAQKAVVQKFLQAGLDADAQTKGTTISVKSAVGQADGSGKRQTVVYATSLIVEADIQCTAVTCASPIATVVQSIAFTTEILNEVASQTTTTTTTAATNRSRSLVRRATADDHVPLAKAYVDVHRMVAMAGNVTTVSFYADRSCALASVQFAAFDLISRRRDDNTAEFSVTAQSGLLQIGSANQMRPYMRLVTIRLCKGDAMWDNSVDGCQGNQFAVLPHQYIGIYSDRCRLGFARPPSDLLDATTLVYTGDSNPLATPHETFQYVPANYTILQSYTIEPNLEKPTAQVEISEGEEKGVRTLFIGSYAPRRCGLAKFLKHLVSSYPSTYGVVAVDETDLDPKTRSYTDEVVFRLRQNERNDYYTVAEMANTEAYDAVNIQHEYGIYGGMNGEYIVALLAAIKKPVIITMHTVLPKPNPFFLSLTRAIAATSTRIVVLSSIGRRLLVDVYGVDESKISVVYHGVPDKPFSPSLNTAKEKLGFDPSRLILTTFGLLHRDKNIELVLKALRTAVQDAPELLYVVIGQTHPAVQMREGNAYLDGLKQNVSAFGLTNNVLFINQFVEDEQLLSYLTAFDIYITPYVHEEQYVSGTLSWAVGLGMAVVSTPYVYAKELLADGRGFLVPFSDPQALSSTIVRLAKDQPLRDSTRRQAYQFGRQMIWPQVAAQMERIFRDTLVYI